MRARERLAFVDPRTAVDVATQEWTAAREHARQLPQSGNPFVGADVDDAVLGNVGGASAVWVTAPYARSRGARTGVVRTSVTFMNLTPLLRRAFDHASRRGRARSFPLSLFSSCPTIRFSSSEITRSARG